jgi:hypothetical protein
VNRPTTLTAATALAALAVVPAVNAATALPQKKGATYTGVTSQGKSGCHNSGSNEAPCTVIDRVSKDGKRVRSTVYFRATCADGNIYQDNVVIGPLRIKNGKYSFTGTYKETLSDGTKLNNAAVTHGTFKRKGKVFRVAGDFKLTSADVTYTDGTTTHCTSPKVTFTAKPK